MGLSAVSYIIVVALLCAGSFDSVRWASRDDSAADEICASRLAFWVVAVSWMQFVAISHLAFLSLWTPLVVAAAMPMGETIVTMMLIPAIEWTLRGCTASSTESEHAPARRPRLYLRERSRSLPASTRPPLPQRAREDGTGEV